MTIVVQSARIADFRGNSTPLPPSGGFQRINQVLHVYNIIELVHAKLTHTYAAARRLSGMPRGPCYFDVFSVSDLFEPPEEGKGFEFPRKPVILADCTTTIMDTSCHTYE